MYASSAFLLYSALLAALISAALFASAMALSFLVMIWGPLSYSAFPTKSPIVLPSCGSGYVGGSCSSLMSTVRTVRSTGASRKTLMVFFKCEDVPFPICTLTCEKMVGIARGG